jgi:putative tryptophan/tyrosine transport system substrate-binding protein
MSTPAGLFASPGSAWLDRRADLSIDCVSAIGRLQELPELAIELVRRRPEVIVAISTPAVRAIKAATTTIPVVGVSGDPVREGLVESLSRPGGNITIISPMALTLTAKRVEILKEIMPGLTRLAVVSRQGADPIYHVELERELSVAAQHHGISWSTMYPSRPEDFEGLFRRLREEKYDAVYLVDGPLAFPNRNIIAEIANRMGLPVIGEARDYAHAGMLVSYGNDNQETPKRLADYVDKILRGTVPGDLPIQQVTKVELVFNLRTARALGINPPASLLARADEVIE